MELNLNEQNSRDFAYQQVTSSNNGADYFKEDNEYHVHNSVWKQQSTTYCSPNGDVVFEDRVSDVFDFPQGKSTAREGHNMGTTASPRNETQRHTTTQGSASDRLEKKRNLTEEQVGDLLPKCEHSQDAKRLIQCRSDQCTRQGSLEARGFCLPHFTELYNRGEVTIPSKAELQPNHRPQQKEQVDERCNLGYTRERRPNFANANRSSSSAYRNPRADRDQERPRTITRPKSFSRTTQNVGTDSSEDSDVEERTKHASRRSKGKHEKRSTRGDETRSHDKKKLCIGGQCSNRGSETYNGFCISCYGILAEANAKDIEMPKPNRIITPKTSHRCTSNTSHMCTQNDSSRKRTFMCPNCGNELCPNTCRCRDCKGVGEGVLCTYCSYSDYTCKYCVESRRSHGNKYQGVRSNNSSKSALRYKHVYVDGAGDGEGGNSLEEEEQHISLVSYQPSDTQETDSSQNILISIGDCDFHYNSRTYFPNDRG